ncbi:hypothetical protein [Phenylobacterium deserti]|uniref:Uncharacterized protein n=1 Tax=Phenylobacterium deserti TaxID=1914756 RepID=A0A328ANM2_9CAUL|nr:hypothetical protein [Phenylobacterium deserti]RAK56540.1 hypothetical protein DJ018_00720 [Phenylobacterium deserti]
MTHTDQTQLRRVLGLDALTCAAAGALMAGAAQPLAGWTGLSPTLLMGAGLSLFPVAALFGWMSRQARVPSGLIWLAVLGNAAWVAASLVVLTLESPTPFGYAFVLGQAAAVAILAGLEARALPVRRAAAV